MGSFHRSRKVIGKSSSGRPFCRLFLSTRYNVEVLSVENLWVAFTHLERSLERAVLNVPLPDCFFDKVLFFFDKRKGIGEGYQ